MSRQLERVHGAVVGAHGRHANLLPLEMYLEEGIPLVLYVRDSPHAEMVELPEQSCHAFISFGTAHGTSTLPPSIKVRQACRGPCLCPGACTVMWNVASTFIVSDAGHEMHAA